MHILLNFLKVFYYGFCVKNVTSCYLVLIISIDFNVEVFILDIILRLYFLKKWNNFKDQKVSSVINDIPKSFNFPAQKCTFSFSQLQNYFHYNMHTIVRCQVPKNQTPSSPSWNMINLQCLTTNYLVFHFCVC